MMPNSSLQRTILRPLLNPNVERLLPEPANFRSGSGALIRKDGSGRSAPLTVNDRSWLHNGHR